MVSFRRHILLPGGKVAASPTSIGALLEFIKTVESPVDAKVEDIEKKADSKEVRRAGKIEWG